MQKDLILEANDMKLVHLVHAHTDLKEDDIQLLLEVSHSLPFIGNLENGDTYVNVLTTSGESLVVAQYRHPNCDLYKRDIIGEVEERENEPAVYRALEQGLSSRGLIGIIDEGRTVVRHTVTPVYNNRKEICGSLTHEYLNTDVDTDPIRIVNKEGKTKINQVISSLQDGLLIYNEDGICTFINAKAEELYKIIGYEKEIQGRTFEELKLTKRTWSEVIVERNRIKDEVRIKEFIFEESINVIWEDGICQGITVILRDKTRIKQLEDELVYRAALVREVHHRVKNNLQSMIALIGLEATQTKSKEIKAFAKNITSHIRSVSMTYELLANTGTETVNLKAMLACLADSIIKNNGVCLCGLEIEVNGDNLELTANVASTIALIVNELIQNSMKHGFGENEEGRLLVTVENGVKYSWITVSDNGCGFDEKDEWNLNHGLGLRLIKSLVKSNLKGEIMMNSSNQGVVTRFSFPSKQIVKILTKSGEGDIIKNN